MSASGKSPNPKNYRANLPRSLDWTLATTQHLPAGDAALVPIVYSKGVYATVSLHPELAYSLSDPTTLVLLRDSARQFHASVVTYFPDSAHSTTGSYFFEDWQGNSKAAPIHIGTPEGTIKAADSYITQTVQVCIEIDGYNYASDDPDDGIAWSETSCDTYSYSQDIEVPTSQLIDLSRLVSQRPMPSEIVIAPPTTPISNIASYFNCFTNGSSPDHTYSVEVCVDQPDPGTRDPWGLTPGGFQWILRSS